MKGLLITLSLLLGGCASMESAFSPETRYGQLYALENALTTASNHCSDEEAAYSATYWAAATVTNIADHNTFLEAGSAPHAKSKELVKQLYSLQHNASNQDSQCQQIAMAGTTTRELIALLNN
jgi:uncharacterized protein YceK